MLHPQVAVPQFISSFTPIMVLLPEPSMDIPSRDTAYDQYLDFLESLTKTPCSLVAQKIGKPEAMII